MNTRTALAFALLALPSVSQAALLYGTLDVTGTVAISTGKIDFVSAPSTLGAGTLAMPGTGTLAITNPAASQTGDFTNPALQGTSVVIENIENSFAPVGASIAELNFLTFTAPGFSNISYELMLVKPGVDSPIPCTMPATVPQSCTPNLPQQSPFNLDNTSSGATASFNVSGVEIDTSTMTSTPFTGTFSATFNGMTYQQLLTQVNGGGTITKGFAATFTTVATPEPGALIQMLSGACLLGLGGLARRKNRFKA